MGQTPTQVWTGYCPRCDRQKISTKSQDDLFAKLRDHVDKAHPDMLNPFIDDGGD